MHKQNEPWLQDIIYLEFYLGSIIINFTYMYSRRKKETLVFYTEISEPSLEALYLLYTVGCDIAKHNVICFPE